jgi:hypothetical protein
MDSMGFFAFVTARFDAEVGCRRAVWSPSGAYALVLDPLQGSIDQIGDFV